jgi:4-amino-4-deoxy-L-arabinose transferase-like glycosyltransferase
LVLLFAYLISKAEYDEDGKAGYFYLSGLVAGAVFLLKSFFVFLVLIILASFYVLKLNKNRITVKKAFAFAAMSAAPVLIWAAARLSRADGAFYFKRFFEIDLLGRLFTKTDMHGYNALYYVQHIAIEHAWLFFIAVLLGVLIKRAGLKNRALLKFIILTALIILFVLSVSKSQRFWYIYSLWPLLSIIAGALLSSLAARKRRGRYTWREFVCLLIFLVFFGLLCRKESDIISAIRNTHPIFAHKAMAIVKERGAAVYKINYERRDKILRGNVCPMSLIYDISQDGKYSNWAFSQSETFIVKVLKGGEPITVGSREDPILRRGGYVL